MSIGLPDWQKNIRPAAPVLPTGQDQLTYFTIDVIAPVDTHTITVYTVPAGKRLYVYFFDVGTAEDVILLYGLRNNNTGDVFYFWGALHGTLQFPPGAGWVFEAGEVLQIKVQNLATVNGTYNVNLFGVVVDA